MSIEVTMRHSDVRIESLKEYAQTRMEKLALGIGAAIGTIPPRIGGCDD